jgi:tyrosine-protein phosphatase non-receptor type 9
MYEFKAVDEFIRIQNWPSNDAHNWNVAVKFLMARRFDVKRALTLYQSHETLRQKEDLHSIDLNNKEFINDLESGKFTILPFVRNEPVCALFTVRLHSSPSNEQNNLITLKTLIYQLDGALEHADAQRNGIIFIYDMNNCKKSNYDLALSQKILTLIRGSYPARLNKLLVVQAPLWFKLLVRLLSVLLRDKLRDRVTFVTNDDVKQFVPLEILPDYLGGCVKVDHKKWLKECERLVNNKSSTCYYY